MERAEFEKLSEKDKQRIWTINLLKGEVAEKYVERTLKNNGYHVSKVAEKDKMGKGAKFYLHSIRISKMLKTAKVPNLLVIMSLLKENYNKGLPDFICRKKKEIRFVEVKSNGAGFSDEQLQTFEMIRSLGFPVDLVRVKTQLDLDILSREECMKVEQKLKEKGYSYYMGGFFELK